MVVFTAEVHKDSSLLGVKRHGLGVFRLGAFGELFLEVCFLDVCFLEGWVVRGLGKFGMSICIGVFLLRAR